MLLLKPQRCLDETSMPMEETLPLSLDPPATTAAPCGREPWCSPQTQARPNRLHTHTHPPKRLAHPRSPIPHSSLDTDLTRNTRAPHFTPQHWLLCHMELY